ncbi:CPBP family intramembrane glutamic endopeptidase [Terribacillus sp. DMT04]|uniref:CPBP family intramembrane glutamic endopeptidase n=1 Tax=Terribacillus sp. DMT04 TaxID=2850441 RepID=UPI001C2BB107|nr:type II CAAX endopeptidase family protein [Terribacillus sp. DMT04]QXE02285.1 CPBP family intramembrane metalloprotease [Terribacillus sp. DMT04]
MPGRYWFIILTYILMQVSSFALIPFVPWMDDQGLDLATVSYWWSVISFFIAVIIVCILLRQDMRSPAMRNATGIGMTLLWIIIGFFGAYFGQVIAGLIEIYVLNIRQTSQNTSNIIDAIQSVPAFVIIVVVFAPILEEIIFRKIIFGEIYKRTNFFVAVLISALLFGVVHGDLLHLLQYFVMGVIFATLYVQTKRIIVPIITHGLMNLMVVIIQLNLTPEKIEQMQKQLENMQTIIFGGIL